MDPSRIAVNFYTLRNRLKAPEDLPRVFGRLAGIGMKCIQCGLPEEGGEDGFMHLCADHGLSFAVAWLPSAAVFDEPQRCIDRLGKVGVTQADYTWPEQVDLNDDASIDRWLVKLEEINQIFRRAGITLGYHNHQIEFIKSRGKSVMQRIFDETTIAFEIDTFWVQVGGESPTDWVRRCAEAGRLPFIHLKDYRIGYNPEEGFVRQFSELGRGGLDFKGIIAAAEAGGCRTYTIEQDDCYGRDEFEAVAESFHYLCDNSGSRGGPSAD